MIPLHPGGVTLAWVVLALWGVLSIAFAAVVTAVGAWTTPTGRPQLHHFYWGALLAVAAYLLPAGWWPLFWLFLLVGFWWMADDVYQHFRQRRDPEYRSPVHRLYGRYLYPRVGL